MRLPGRWVLLGLGTALAGAGIGLAVSGAPLPWAPFAGTLLVRGCKVVVASGTAERAAVLADAARFGSVRFVVEGAAPGSPANVTALVFSTSGLRAGVASAVEAGVHAAGG